MRAVARVIALLVLALPAVAGAGDASEIAREVSFQPPVPTSRDEVAVRIAGIAATPCVDPALFPSVAGRTVRLDLDLGRCVARQRAAGPTSFTAATALGPLPAGRYAVQVFTDGVLQKTDVLEVASAESTAGLVRLSGLGTLLVVLLLALAGSVLLK